MFIQLLLLHILGNFCDHSGIYGISSPTAAPTCSSSEKFVASSERLHQTHCRPSTTSSPNPIKAPLCGSSTSTSHTPTHCSGVWEDDRVLEMQTVLESPQWETPTLSALWWTLEQNAGSELRATRKGAFPAPKSRGRSPHVRSAQDSGWNWDVTDGHPQRDRSDPPKQQDREEDDAGQKTKTRARHMQHWPCLRLGNRRVRPQKKQPRPPLQLRQHKQRWSKRSEMPMWTRRTCRPISDEWWRGSTPTAVVNSQPP